jgi:hypothetical protein
MTFVARRARALPCADFARRRCLCGETAALQITGSCRFARIPSACIQIERIFRAACRQSRQAAVRILEIAARCSRDTPACVPLSAAR